MSLAVASEGSRHEAEPLVPEGATYSSITATIADPVLKGSPGRGWWIAMALRSAARADYDDCDRVAALERHRRSRQQYDGSLGVPDRQLRVVDRHRQCGHADFGAPAVDAPKVAGLDQPLRRSDDAVRGLHRRPVPDSASGPAAVFLLVGALPEHHEASGRSGEARWSGISGRSSAISCSRSSSSMLDCFPISPPFVIAPGRTAAG